MSKQYGLILPGQHKKAAVLDFTRPSIFDESTSESDDNSTLQMKMKKAPMGSSLIERRKAKNLQEKALAEDPTIFQYDELYDEMEFKRDEEKLAKSKEPKKARYITKLMETAEKRKLENELRVERQVQKERETEGQEFKDKETFVTSTYRKKLEEMRKLEEKNRRDDYLEAIGDVTKQRDLDGFYRHIYEQKMSTSKGNKKPNVLPVSYKPMKSEKPQRAYRKRKSSDEEEIGIVDSLNEEHDKRVHLTNNIDADSDFSIDYSSTESENEGKKQFQTNNSSKNFKRQAELSKTQDDIRVLNVESINPIEVTESIFANVNNMLQTPIVDAKLGMLTEQRKDKSEVWRKRTVGEVHIAAVKKYCERKAARNKA